MQLGALCRRLIYISAGYTTGSRGGRGEARGIWLPFRVMLQEVVSNFGIVLWFGAHNQMESDSRWDRSDDGRLESMISGIRASGKLWIRGSEVIGVGWSGSGGVGRVWVVLDFKAFC